LIPGANTSELEERFAELAGVGEAVAVSSGTAALEIALRSLQVASAAVLVPANTNYATAEAVLRAGCRPVLYDAGLYPRLRAVQDAWTPEISALVVVHIGGYLSPDLPQLRAWCQRRGMRLVEDASHAHGARLHGRPAGSFGHAAAWSMFATKVLTTSEGGMVTTSDPRVAALARRYRDQGKADDGQHHVLFGSAWRMSELHAALGVVQLDALPERLDRVQRVLRRYATEILHPQVRVPLHDAVFYSGHKAIVEVADMAARGALREHLVGCGIGWAKGVYEVPLHRQPILRLGAGQAFPVADRFAGGHLCLPLWRGLTDHDVDRVVTAVNHWPGNGR
jgi:dTDP-4-amino-4,6-dideoxygalactose transaminase